MSVCSFETFVSSAAAATELLLNTKERFGEPLLLALVDPGTDPTASCTFYWLDLKCFDFALFG